MADKKSKRVKAPVPAPEGERARPRVKAGAPGNPVALPGDPEPPQETAKKAAPKGKGK